MWCSHSLGHLGQSWSSWSSFRFLVLASSSIQPVSPDPLELFEPHISDMYFWMEIHGVRCIRSFWFFIFFELFFDMITGLQWINWLVFGQSCLDLPLVLASPSIQPVSLDPFEIFESHISNMNFSMEINGVRSFCFFCDIIFQLSMIRRLQWIHWLVFGCLASHDRYDIMIVMSWSSLIFFLCPPVPMFHHSASQWSWGYRIHWRVQMASTAKKICVCMCTLVKLTMIFMMYNMFTTLHSKIIHSCEPMFRHMELIRGRVGRPSRHCMICMLYFTVSNISNPIQPWLMWNKCKYIKYKYLI